MEANCNERSKETSGVELVGTKLRCCIVTCDDDFICVTNFEWMVLIFEFVISCEAKMTRRAVKSGRLALQNNTITVH
jgi:hypothetical protein